MGKCYRKISALGICFADKLAAKQYSPHLFEGVRVVPAMRHRKISFCWSQFAGLKYKQPPGAPDWRAIPSKKSAHRQ